MRSFCALLLCIVLAACTVQSETAPEIADFPEPAPASRERWIEADLARQMVRLHQGERVVGEYLAATGRGDSPATLTYTGTFTVHNKIKPLTYLPGFDVYVTDWVGFDAAHAIGFHSLPKDRYGRIIDSRLGAPVSHGCIRVGNAAAVYNFAAIGMKVVVH